MTITSKRILLVGKICGDNFDWTIAPPPEPVDEANAAFDVPAECSFFAHLMPCDGELQRCIDEAQAVDSAYVLGQDDYAAGRYCPPFARDEHAAYIKGQNDAWAMANNVTWWRRGSER